MKVVPIIALAIALTGCGTADAPKPQTIVKYIPAHVEPECLTDDQVWTNPPDRDETRSQTAWRDSQNKTAFDSVSSDHAACRAGLIASQPKPKRKKSNG